MWLRLVVSVFVCERKLSAAIPRKLEDRPFCSEAGMDGKLGQDFAGEETRAPLGNSSTRATRDCVAERA